MARNEPQRLKSAGAVVGRCCPAGFKIQHSGVVDEWYGDFSPIIRFHCAKLNIFLLRVAASSATKAKKPMTPELQRALTRHTQWFGSYKASGELKKIHVWLLVTGGQIEFLTPGNSYKVKRARRNPRVICYVGSSDGPAISGTAQIVTDRSEVARVYRGYWRVHPLRMAIVVGLRLWIEMLLNKRVVVRVQPDEPNPLAGLTDPAV